MTTYLRVTKIKFDPNRVKSSNALELENVTILVGPHNSGKSQTLRDINAWCWNYPDQLKLIEEIELYLPSERNLIEELLKDFRIEVPADKSANPNLIYLRPPYTPVSKAYDQINLDQLRSAFSENKIDFFKNSSLNLLSYFVIRLDGKTRFDLIKDRPRGNMNSFPMNDLDSLYRKDETRKELRKIIFEEFEWYFYISHIQGTDLKIVLDKNPNLDERSLGNEAIQQFKSSQPLDNFGDGIKCFVGILVATFSYCRRILLVDEPEAFLHPSAARSLGRNLSSITVTRDCSLIVGTHSADFLMGCLQATKKIAILRLTYDYNKGTVTQLDSDDIKKLSTDPILKSVDSLSALFHKSSVVCEAGDDKVFYQAANSKLLESNIGIQDNLFLNVNGKYGIYKLVKPLRKTGIPVASIYDFDAIKIDEKNKDESEKLWKNIVSANNIDNDTEVKLKVARLKINEELTELNRNQNNVNENLFRNLKRDLINPDLKSSIDSFLEELSLYGIFVVPVGELESWLPDFPRNEEWLSNALNAIETTDPKLAPVNSILSFLLKIKTWVEDPNRRGMTKDTTMPS